jgi:protein-serine/threonine kinase
MTALAAKRNTSMPHNTSDGGKRTFSGLALSNNQKVSGGTGQKIKNFFRIQSGSKNGESEPASETASIQKEKDSKADGSQTPQSTTTKSLRHSRFIPHIGRSRSTTVASEGNPLDDGMSPAATANPYFQHQGLPGIRHHNDSSVPPSPPDTPETPRKTAAKAAQKDAAGTSGKEELARKLRRVASAPNAQGLFSSKSKSKGSADSSGSRPGTAEFESPIKVNGKLGAHQNASALSMVETVPNDDLLPIPAVDGALTPGKIRNSVAFRRTYSSNSIKVRTVEVGPGSFDKIKLIGKGDVGKVYLVREKKSSRLYAMKGEKAHPFFSVVDDY